MSIVPLWEGADASSMRLVFPKNADAKTPALIVFRGGAYATNAGSGGGSAEWAAQNGMLGIEVSYRLQFPHNFSDAARAVRITRSRAPEWNVDPARIGVLGYSAGGHLASLLSTQSRVHVDANDDLAHVDARPSFVILSYPVISFVANCTPGSLACSTENFFGTQTPSEEMRKKFSNELHVDSTHPPVFVWTTADDSLVPASHAELFAEACERARVLVKLEIFPHGPHGMGLALDDAGDVRMWTSHALAWLRALR